jgi:hypothetical protein
VTIPDQEGLPYGPLVGGRRGKPEDGNHPIGIYHQRHLEAVDPLGLGSAPPEGGLPTEQPLARCPHPHDGRDEGRVHHAVECRRVRKVSGQRLLQRAQLGLQVS